MKYIVTILSAVIVFSFFCSQEKDKIAHIKARYQQISQGVKTYTRKTLDDNFESADGGKIDAYYSGSQLQFITTEYFAEGGKAKHEYYFEDGKLVFVIYKEFTYNRPYYWDKKMAKENNDTAW